MAGDERDPPRDPLETLQLEPEDLARLRDLSAPSDASPRAPQVSIPFELTREVKEDEATKVASSPARPQQLSVPFELTQAPAVPLRQLLSPEPPRGVSVGRVLAYVLTLLVLTGAALYVLVWLGVIGPRVPWAQ